MSKTSRPFDPAKYTTIADVLKLAASLEDRVEKLEAALKAIAEGCSEPKTRCCAREAIR